jgi:hypothetical protein
MPAHKFRGREDYNPNQGTDLYIRKLSPGSEESEGYEVDIYENKKFQETRKVNSKKKVMEIVREYKEFYNTDRAFLNEMHLFLTYKLRNRESFMINDDILYKKANEIESKLIKLFNPITPIKVKKALDDSSIPISSQNSEQASTPTTTEDVIKKSTDIINKFIQDNKELLESEDKSKGFNAIMSWVYKFKDAITKENENGANLDIDAISDALSREFSKYDFIKETKHANDSSIVLTVEEPTDDGIDISTEEAIESLIDSLNAVSEATKSQIQSAETISDELIPTQAQEALKEMHADFSLLNAKTNEFLDFIKSNKFSGVLDDLLANWIISDNSLNLKQAKLLKEFVEIEINPKLSSFDKYKIKYAAMFHVFIDYLTSSFYDLGHKTLELCQTLIQPNVTGFLWDDFAPIITDFLGNPDSTLMDGAEEHAIEFMRHWFLTRPADKFNKVVYPQTEPTRSAAIFKEEAQQPQVQPIQNVLIITPEVIAEIQQSFTEDIKKVEVLADDFFTEYGAALDDQEITLASGKDGAEETKSIYKFLQGASYKDSAVYQSTFPMFISILSTGISAISPENVSRSLAPMSERKITKLETAGVLEAGISDRGNTYVRKIKPTE